MGSRPPALPPDDLADRFTSVLEGRMSLARRFFCLLTLFQLLFVFLLWSIVCALASANERISIKEEFDNEISNYTFHSSLFDILFYEIFRAIILLIIYGFFSLSLSIPVAVTTLGTTALVLTKAFLYENFGHHYGPMLFVVSVFVLAWGQTLHLDFQVLPLEKAVAIKLAEYINSKRPFLPTLEQHCSSEYHSPQSSRNSSQGDIDEPPSPSPCDVCAHQLSSEELLLKRQAEQNLEESLAILRNGTWRTEKVSGLDVVQSCSTPHYGKVFKFVGLIHYPPDKLLKTLRDDHVEQWNPTLKSNKVIQKIDDYVDIVHTVTYQALGGIVASRDFVNLRSTHQRGTTLIQSFAGISHPDMPQIPSFVRAEQGPSLYILSPLENDPNKCHFEWMVNVDLKGYLSKSLVERTISSTMLDFVENLKKHINTAQSNNTA